MIQIKKHENDGYSVLVGKTEYAAIQPDTDRVQLLSRKEACDLAKALVFLNAECVYYEDNIDKTDDVMTVKKFCKCVKDGGFINDDGHGYFCKDGLRSTLYVQFCDGEVDEIKKTAKRYGFTHIVWYNR